MSAAAAPRLRVAFVTPVALDLASGGGRTAAESFLGALAAVPGIDVEVLPLRAIREVLPHRVRQALAFARALFSSLPAKSLYDAAPADLRRVKAALAGSNHDLVVINGGELFFLARALADSQRCIGLALNVESELYAEQTRRIRNLPLVGALPARDLGKLERVEMEGVQRLQGIVCLSSVDAAAFAKVAPEVPRLLLPTSFAYPPFEREVSRPVGRTLRLGMLAKYRWWPNAQALEWLVGRVLPGLPQDRVELHLYGPESERFSGRHPAIVAHGFVSDLGAVWRNADFMVCPIVSGSGINVKLVEAVYNNVPVLATSHALRGLPPIDDPAIVRLDTPEEWIAFLSGPEAEALARRKPAPGITERFSQRQSAPLLERFVRAVMTRPR